MNRYLILFYGVEIVKEDPVVTVESGKVTQDQERHFLPFIKEFMNEAAAKKWANENINMFFDAKKTWLQKHVTKVYSVPEISSHGYERAMMLTEAKQQKEDNLRDIVFKYMNEVFERDFLFIMTRAHSDKTFRSDDERLKASADFMIQSVRKAREKELGEYATFFAGDYNTKVQSALIKYFKQREGLKTIAQSA